jgi:hypothetical protein
MANQSKVIKIDDSSSTSTLSVLRKTGWFTLSDMGHKVNVRRFNIRYLSEDDVTVTIYTDGDESSVVKTITITKNSGNSATNLKKYRSISVGRRAQVAMVKIVSSSTDNPITIYKMELEVDGN